MAVETRRFCDRCFEEITGVAEKIETYGSQQPVVKEVCGGCFQGYRGWFDTTRTRPVMDTHIQAVMDKDFKNRVSRAAADAGQTISEYTRTALRNSLMEGAR